MDLLVADIIVILNWFNSRWSYFGFQLGVSKFFSVKEIPTRAGPSRESRQECALQMKTY